MGICQKILKRLTAQNVWFLSDSVSLKSKFHNVLSQCGIKVIQYTRFRAGKIEKLKRCKEIYLKCYFFYIYCIYDTNQNLCKNSIKN